jgi:hypothetical protein
MFRGRKFSNQFSEELNYCNENEIDGVYNVMIRFRQFAVTLEEKIDSDNHEILKELEKEDDDTAQSIIQQPHMINSLEYFKDIVFKSLFVSAYSFFDYKFLQIRQVCEKHVPNIQTFKEYKREIEKQKQPRKSSIEITKLYIEQFIPDLNVHDKNWTKILTFKKIRDIIVHENSEDANQITTSVDLIAIDEEFQIHIEDRKFLIEFLHLIENYLIDTVKYINDKFNLIEYHTLTQ